MRLIISDDCPAYKAALLDACGDSVEPPRTGRSWCPKEGLKTPLAGPVNATVEKVRNHGRIVEVLTHVVFGMMAAVAAALVGSRDGRSISSSSLGR